MTPQISIKNFVDCPEVLPLIASRIYAQWFANKPGFTEEGMLHRMRGGLRNGVPIGLVAFVDQVPAGTVSLIENDLDERPDLSPWLAGLLVFPDFRSQGVGSALVCALMNLCAELCISPIYLYTDKPKFYERLGWVTECEVLSDPGCFVMSCQPGMTKKSDSSD